MNLNEYGLHDYIIKEICINSKKDFMDEVIIKLQDNCNHIYKIVCKESVFCNIKGNGWISGNDSVRNIDYKVGKECKEIIPNFIPDNIADKMKYIDINLNTSNSDIQILAKNIEINS